MPLLACSLLQRFCLLTSNQGFWYFKHNVLGLTSTSGRCSLDWCRGVIIEVLSACRLSNQITLSYPQRSTFSESLSRLNPSQQIARLKDAGRRVREHLQRPTLERSMTTDPLFHDEETDDIMRPSIIPGPIQTVPPMQAPPPDFESTPAVIPVQQEAAYEAGPSVTFHDKPTMLPEYYDEPLSGSEGETMPSISEVNVLQAPSPMYRRYASFTRSSMGSGMQKPPKSPFDAAQHPAGLSAGPVLSDRPILSAAPSIPAASRKFNRQKSGDAAAIVHTFCAAFDNHGLFH